MEEWRTVVLDNEVFPNYEVSTEGRVRNKDTGNILKPSQTKKGYLHVTIWQSEKRKQKTCYIHRIVAWTYIPNDDPENKTEVNHINEDKTCNHVENLEWCTREQNVHHGTGIERQAQTKTNDPSRSKKVLCVETGIIYDSVNEVGRKTGLPCSNIVACLKGRIKTCGGFHWQYIVNI